MPAGREVLEAVATAANRVFGFAFEDFGWGGDHYRRHGVMMPIVDSVARVLFERVTPQQAIHDLLAREARGEA